MRLTFEELNELKNQYGVSELWSFSKFDTYRTSKFEWLLKYIQKKPENSDKPSAYSTLGSVSHQCLEDYYDGKLKIEDMFEEFDDAFTTNIDIAELYFDRCDSEKNNNIKNKYYVNMEHFFKNFQPSLYKCLMEQFVAIKITDDIVMQGYIDCLHKEEDGTVVITDFKTSTMYSGKAINEHVAQLVLYSEGLRQKGIPQDKIKARWEFLKYVNIDCEQINGNIKERSIERREIGEKLQASIKSWMKKLKYDENTIFDTIDQVIQSNSIDCLPDDIRCKYTIKPCYVYIDDIWGFYENELKPEIVSTVSEIRDKVKQYNILKKKDIEAAEHLFWDDEESLKEQSYYYNNLCGYSIPTIKPYKEYLDKLNADKNGDIFGNSIVKKSNNDEYDEDDLSWLNDL